MRAPRFPALAGQPLTLICLPHAGGSAMLYRDWFRTLPPSVKVYAIDLPGRGTRRALRPHTEWAPLVEQLSDELLGPLEDGPFAVFGHSMGALVGLELIHAARRRWGRTPVWFGASATVAPARRPEESHWIDCPAEAMVEFLRERGGTPPELLHDQEFIELVLPVLRADFHLCGTHPRQIARRTLAAGRHEPLDCPVTVFAGRDDAATANAADLSAWAEETRRGCEVHRFDGGHFFLDTAPEPVLATLAAALAAALEAGGREAGLTLTKDSA
jgi:surfactin synthase thioesterase subunit